MRQVITALRYPRSISDHNLLLRSDHLKLGKYFVTAFIDDLLGLAETYDATVLLATMIT